MSVWNSIPLQITYHVFGWVTSVAWSVSLYPQVILNFRRKSVVGLSFDYVVLNMTKHLTYLIYNATLFFSSAVQRQYRQKYGHEEMIPVAANDVAFSVHCVLITAVTLVQIVIYDRGTQKISKTCHSIVFSSWLAAGVCLFLALPNHSWLWLISVFNTIQALMTALKYIPQCTLACTILSIKAFMNYRRNSTSGFSIGNILLDLFGGVTNYGQMVVQSIDQGSWVNFYGNIGKTSVSLVSISFDILFVCHHFVVYASKKVESEDNLEEPLHKSKDGQENMVDV